MKASPAEKAGVFTTPATGGRKASGQTQATAAGDAWSKRNGDLDVYRQRVTVQDGQPAPVVGHEFK